MPAGVEGKEFTADTGYILSYENKKATYYTGSYDFSATKQLDGTTDYASGNTYTFKNFAVEEVSADAANATMVKDITTGTTDGSTTGAITFAGKASYSSATAGDVGTHYYKVYETSSGYTDVTTDTNYYILTVDVALDNATNPTKLVATCSKITKYNSAGTGTTASKVVFNNTTVTTTIQGTKSWVGGTTADRPSSIQVRLYKLKQGGNENDVADWEQVGADRTVDAASAWKYSFGKLPKYYPGMATEIPYKVVETAVAGYTTSYPAGTYDIVNTMIQTSGSITFTALKKLDEEQQNLVRVMDILSELTRQLEPLEKQSETARVYLSKRETLKELDVNMFLMEYAAAAKELKELEEKNIIAQNQLKDTQSSYDRTKVEYERLEQELEDLNSKMDALRISGQEQAIRKQQLEGQINVLNEQILAGAQNEEHYKGRIQTIEAELSVRTDSKKKLEEEKTDIYAQLKAVRKKLSEEEEKLRTAQENMEACTLEVENGKNEIIEILNSRANVKGKAQRFDAMMEQAEIRKAEISQRILRLKSEEEEQQTILTTARKQYDEITSQIENANEECEHLNLSVMKIQEKLKEQNTKLEAEQTAYHREASRLDSLRNIAERYDGYGNSIRRVMEQKERVPGIQGVVADLIQVNKDYEIAIETALGGSIQNIVTDNEQTAKTMIEFLKKNRYGRATFLPMSSISPRGEFTPKEALKEPGVVGIASELVSVASQYQQITKFLLGRVLVVDNIDHAIAIGKKYRHSLRMVTTEGESLSPGGSMTGGAFRNNSNLLGRRREIEELETKVNQLKQNLTEMQNAVEENKNQRNRLRDAIAGFQEKLRQKYIEQNTARMNIKQQEKKAEEIRSGYAQINRDQAEIKRQVMEIRQDHDRIARELENSKQDEKELESFIEAKQSELDEWKEEEKKITRELEEIRLQSSALEQKEKFDQENLSRLKAEITAFMTEKEDIYQSLAHSSEEMEKKQEMITQLKKESEESVLHEEQAQMQLKNLQKEKESRTSQHKDFFEKRDYLSGQIGLLDKECYRLQGQMDKLEENREERIAYMWSEYEITPNNAVSYRKEELTDLSQMKRQAAQIKDDIRKLGPVNVNAIEDYKELLERHTFLSGQYEDLVTAEKTLEQIIQELDEGMRKQFSEKFGEIQKEFDKAFKELFGGGKGTLELDEEADILEAGIKIISQPPGKKLQNMMQLSGGEKALTAIALLFAIQNLKPSPFCLLDEIEAALDDSNVGRFAGYLQKLTKNTQFIIITHRRGTMNAADRLYGITMQEKGVSTLVSVDLVENQLTQ